MRPNDDEIRGKIDQASGTVKEHIGRASGDVDLEDEGAGQRIEIGRASCRERVYVLV